jgi:N-acetylmuramoyl-L-alanine amidase
VFKRWGILIILGLLGGLLILTIPVLAANEGIVTGTIVNVREGPGQDIKAQVKIGQTLPILAEKNGWYQVCVHTGLDGWISGEYFSPIIKNITVTGNTVNLRSGPATTYKQEGQVKAGQALVVLAEKDGWYQVLSPQFKKVWICANYVEEKEIASPVKGSVVIITNVLNVRQGPGTNYPELTKIGLNERHQALESKNGWYKIKVNNLEGWVSGDYVEFIAETTGETPARDNVAPKEVLIVPLAAEKTFIVVDRAGKPEIVLEGWSAEEFNLIQEGSTLIFELQGPSTRKYEGKLERLGITRVNVYPRGEKVIVELDFNFQPDSKIGATDAQKKTLIRLGVLPISTKGLQNRLIVLDPGHASIQPGGGLDPGAIGTRLKLQEKDVNLGVALKLKTILEKAGAKVVMTHTGSTNLTLAQRAGVANSLQADVFVSIHADSGKPGVSGHTTYFYAPSNHNVLGAQRAQRLRLATLVQRELVKSGGRRDIGVREENFAVLRETRVPSILVETAFLTDRIEEVLLSQDWFQEKLAEGIANGLRAYFN